MDLLGSFITDEQCEAYSEVKDVLGSVITNLFEDHATNFLSAHSLSGLQVKRGDNNLDTCFQFKV